MKNGWIQVEFKPNKGIVQGSTAWQKGECWLIFSPIEVHSNGAIWKHVSISCKNRYPTWEEILDARYSFFDETSTVIQVLPPKDEYINFHPNTFHLWCRLDKSIFEN